MLGVLALPATAAARQVLIGSGSSAEQPILNVLFKAYSKLHRSIAFVYTPNGGNAGVKDVQSGRSAFAVNTRPPLPSDSGTTQYKLYLDGLCVAVNPANSLANLSVNTTKNIFLGLSTSWSGIPGSNLSTTIDPIGRNSTAGSYTFFQSAILGGKTQASNVIPQTSDGLVATAIKNDANAIGYVGLAHAGSGSGIKPLTLNGVACNATTIKNETYPLFRYIWGVLPTAHPSVAAERFLDWLRTDHNAGRIIARAGAVPAFNK